MTARYGQLANFFLKMSDLVLMLSALLLAIVINYAPSGESSVPAYTVDFLSTRIKLGNALLGGLLIVVWYIAFELQGLYRSHRLTTCADEMKEIGRAVFAALGGIVDRCADRPMADGKFKNDPLRGGDCPHVACRHARSVATKSAPVATAWP